MRDNLGMAATESEGTARKLVTRKCVRTMNKASKEVTARKDGNSK